MSLSPEDYNSLFSPTLHVCVIDVVRMQHSQGGEVTSGTIVRALVQRVDLKPHQRWPLRKRVYAALRDLERAGLITTTEVRVPNRNLYHKRIVPCRTS